MNWSGVIARRIVESKDGPDGRAVLLVPRFRKGFLSRWLQPRLKRPYVNVNLDDYGSFVWHRIDGTKDFARICGEMMDKFGDKLPQAEDRLQQFLTILQRNKFIELFTPADE